MTTFEGSFYFVKLYSEKPNGAGLNNEISIVLGSYQCWLSRVGIATWMKIFENLLHSGKFSTWWFDSCNISRWLWYWVASGYKLYYEQIKDNTVRGNRRLNITVASHSVRVSQSYLIFLSSKMQLFIFMWLMFGIMTSQ